jgi:hypothetical protein
MEELPRAGRGPRAEAIGAVTCDHARVAPGDLTRDQLIEIVDKIMRCDPSDEDEQDKLLGLFENNVLHPRASSFIYFPEHELGAEYERRSLTPEQVVDHVLAYKPIELGPAE